jgi:hypothetical protein
MPLVHTFPLGLFVSFIHVYVPMYVKFGTNPNNGLNCEFLATGDYPLILLQPVNFIIKCFQAFKTLCIGAFHISASRTIPFCPFLCRVNTTVLSTGMHRIP